MRHWSRNEFLSALAPVRGGPVVAVVGRMLNVSFLRNTSIVCLLALAACGHTDADVQSEDLVGSDDAVVTQSALTACVTIGAKLKTTANVNFRGGASTSDAILMVVPTGVLVSAVASCPKNGYYNVSYSGRTGWVYGAYVVLSTVAPGPRDAAISRAQSGVGFSYWWGGSTWNPDNRTSTAFGACYGSCPSCTHSGTYGADCSGYAGKVWQVPSGNTSLTTVSHPYVSGDWMRSTSYWTVISRTSVAKADAFASTDHIFLYESGDPWGQVYAYEAKGCSYGIVRNLRTVSTAYVASKRAGY